MRWIRQLHKRIFLFSPLRTTVTRHHSLPSTHQKVPFPPIKAPIQRSESSVPDGIHINSDVVYIDSVVVFINHDAVYRFRAAKKTFIPASFIKLIPINPINFSPKNIISKRAQAPLANSSVVFSVPPPSLKRILNHLIT